ncbi:MAG: hypothetical protein IJO19_03925 [Clostridia bacterium]|nr:hypothetical protein [Clostridia bacterium]
MSVQNVFSVDGTFYDVSVDALKITGEKISSDSTGRLKNLEMYIKYRGIFVNYEITISPKKRNNAQFFTLFNHLTFDKGNEKHTLKFPYGNKMYTFIGYCPNTAIELAKFKGQTVYDDYKEITLQFIATKKAVSPL